MSSIFSFSGEYRWLSNFYPCSLYTIYKICPTVEHAYQAAKAESAEDAECIAGLATPGQAKRAGRIVRLRPGWNDDTKRAVMAQLIGMKFNPVLNPTLAAQLIATGDTELVEGNGWGDTFWGKTRSAAGVWSGENHLGQILMNTRRTYQMQGAR